MKQILIFILLFSFPHFGFAGQILKVKGNKIFASFKKADSDFLFKGDLFFIQSQNGETIGTARILQTKNNQSILRFSGEAASGMKLVSQKSATRQIASDMYQPKTISSNSQDSNYKYVTTAQYVAGGVVGTFVLPFGLGHAVQRRYLKTGWIFTLGEIGSLLLMGIGIGLGANILKISSGNVDVGNLNAKAGFGLALAGMGSISLFGFKIWEIIDVWSLPSHYRVSKNKQLSISPVLYAQNDNSKSLGLSFNFKF